MKLIQLTFKKSKLLYLSSGEIFGENQNYIKKENSMFKSDNYYSECKIKSHKLIQKYKTMKLLNLICQFP